MRYTITDKVIENMYAGTPRHREGVAADNRQPMGSQASIARPTPTRHPLGVIDPNIDEYVINAGMSASMKIGRHAGSTTNRAVPGAPHGLGNSILGTR